MMNIVFLSILILVGFKFMIIYKTGNILETDSQCIVNTVNCEGYMGKGLAYQFKKAYPENEKAYKKACKTGEIAIGKVFLFEEDNKIIANFPTKDKWRLPSKMEYIKLGLLDLINKIVVKQIYSIAIPPLGSGNGGLNWEDVRKEIESYFYDLSEEIEVVVYEPAGNIQTNLKPKKAPKLSLSHYVVSKIESLLKYYNVKDKTYIRLQKSCYFFNYFYRKDYFDFKAYKYGPYSHDIEIVSKKINEYMLYYDIKDYNVLCDEVYKTIISKKIESELDNINNAIKLSSEYVNNIESNSELECLTTIMVLIKDYNYTTEEDIIKGFKDWEFSKEKSKRFKEKDILNSINYLLNTNIISKGLLGYNFHF